ncbi:type I-F CRISPR-associated endoribonuclease Cas6/Csy4 [Vibrio tapetis]|uniref:CRISPR-associated protein, Csy4 family n=1 Tax=Vibrio tapetis subsp. tapetis TaxID=1671868 RepID=A0A2N8ZDD7_9VIBR|nr:type I-F CRISPR-associated endoribonuclease Cas6/Csy4 [Vibrio tapetis]SON49914.1 CRISPR-associated protein, Csy4 family [Vibrio tapetis subsp. tapetis]
MPKRYFFTIRYIPERADCGLLAGRCIEQMHGFAANNPQAKSSIGVSFPSWCSESVGHSIAFVAANKDLLVGLSFQPYFSLMVNEGLFEVSTVDEVPNELPELRFVRNQAIGKSFVGSKKRRIKRSLVRSETIDEKHLPKANEIREFEHFHKVPISSGSSGQDFILHLQREQTVESVATGFNCYGFATNKDWRGTVPDFRFNPN